MSTYTTSAILLRRIDFGDYDLILTFLSRDRGKLPALAKAAKKSVKRFGGVLELFSHIELVVRPGRGNGLPLLQEASLIEPFSRIRSNVLKTAYASYWAELIDHWIEEHEAQTGLYMLLGRMLTALDTASADEKVVDAALNLLFQMRFLCLSGMAPHLSACSVCQQQTEQIDQRRIRLDLKRGGLVCDRCSKNGHGPSLAKGSIKELLWCGQKTAGTAGRIRFSAQTLAEGQTFLEAFIPFHLGRYPKSLDVLRQLRRDGCGVRGQGR